MPCPGTTLPRRGISPFKKTPAPSCRINCWAQSSAFLYFAASNPCIRVLITSVSKKGKKKNQRHGKDGEAPRRRRKRGEQGEENWTADLPRGLLHRVEKQPADIPPRKEVSGVRLCWPLLVTQFLYSLKNIKRRPWFDPCFIIVAPKPCGAEKGIIEGRSKSHFGNVPRVLSFSPTRPRSL